MANTAPALPSDKAIDLYERLVDARRLQLHPALARTINELGVAIVDQELGELVPADALTRAASLGVRGERVFPVPSVLMHTPPLIGYYRMLLGLSKKEFRKVGFARWASAEERGVISERLRPELKQLCVDFITPLATVVSAINSFDDRDLSDLTLLTLGPTLQGGRNNVIGSLAATQVFHSIRALVNEEILFRTETLIRFRTAGGDTFTLRVGSDPDIRLDAEVENQIIPILAVEVKGGRDASNAHNRAGEAEKSQIKARYMGYSHRWTIIVMQGVNRQRIERATPSSTDIFETSQVIGGSGSDWQRLRSSFGRLLIERLSQPTLG